MDTKYQVFVSSTYKDLLEERQEVMQALLELDCIPVGMELFPAADDDQWTLIKGLIDDCDYYVLIIGGRYGSTSDTGISYTQMEYEYALKKNIPIISFLPKNSENIPVGKAEKNEEGKKRLEEFKNFVQQKMCRFWSDPKDLGSQVSRSLVKLIKSNPRPGWIKADNLPSIDATKEILELTKENERLKEEIRKSQSIAPEGTEGLSSGDDTFEVKFQYTGRGTTYSIGNKTYTLSKKLTWNEIFAEISPLLIDETTEDVLKIKISNLILSKSNQVIIKQLNEDSRKLSDFTIIDTDFQTIKIQFRALNYMTESLKKRSIHDKKKYWTLTSYGDTVMTRLRAIRK